MKLLLCKQNVVLFLLILRKSPDYYVVWTVVHVRKQLKLLNVSRFLVTVAISWWLEPRFFFVAVVIIINIVIMITKNNSFVYLPLYLIIYLFTHLPNTQLTAGWLKATVTHYRIMPSLLSSAFLKRAYFKKTWELRHYPICVGRIWKLFLQVLSMVLYSLYSMRGRDGCTRARSCIYNNFWQTGVGGIKSTRSWTQHWSPNKAHCPKYLKRVAHNSTQNVVLKSCLFFLIPNDSFSPRSSATHRR